MNSRILKRAAVLAVLPLLTVLLTFRVWGSRFPMLSVLLLGTAVQVSAVQWFKCHFLQLIHPSDDLMHRMGTAREPIPYEPDRYRTDARIAELAIWLSVPAPLLAFLARAFPREYTVTVLNNLVYTGPNWTLLLLAFVCTLMGAMAFCLWVYLEQARTVYSEPSEKRRYQLNGFASSLEADGGLNRVLAARRARRAAYHRI